jgi:hypothetical protein
MNYANLSDAELEQSKLALDASIAELRDQKRLIAAEQERRFMFALLQKRLDGMTDAQRQALAQMIHAEGIESGEQFGG